MCVLWLVSCNIDRALPASLNHTAAGKSHPLLLVLTWYSTEVEGIYIGRGLGVGYWHPAWQSFQVESGERRGECGVAERLRGATGLRSGTWSGRALPCNQHVSSAALCGYSLNTSGFKHAQYMVVTAGVYVYIHPYCHPCELLTPPYPRLSRPLPSSPACHPPAGAGAAMAPGKMAAMALPAAGRVT